MADSFFISGASDAFLDAIVRRGLTDELGALVLPIFGSDNRLVCETDLFCVSRLTLVSLLDKGNGEIDLVNLIPVAMLSLLAGGNGDIDLVSIFPVDLLTVLSLPFLGNF